MKAKKVQRARFHIGVQIGAEVITGIDEVRQKVGMELTNAGLYVKVGGNWPDKFVPFSNITEITFVKEEAA